MSHCRVLFHKSCSEASPVTLRLLPQQKLGRRGLSGLCAVQTKSAIHTARPSICAGTCAPCGSVSKCLSNLPKKRSPALERGQLVSRQCFAMFHSPTNFQQSRDPQLGFAISCSGDVSARRVAARLPPSVPKERLHRKKHLPSEAPRGRRGGRGGCGSLFGVGTFRKFRLVQDWQWNSTCPL